MAARPSPRTRQPRPRRPARGIATPRSTKQRHTAPPQRPSAAALQQLYDRLLDAYGPQSWWPAGTELEMVLGALLVQNTAWTSARKALDNLTAAGRLQPAALLAAPEAEIAELIRPSGYFNSKARKLKAFAQMLADQTDGDLNALLAKPLHELRPLLLATHGFGPETADAVCLFAARHPTFVIDAYTRRILDRLDLVTDKPSYAALQATFMDALPPRVPLYAEYHGLLVVHAKQTCTKKPQCGACPLLDLCPTGQAETGLIAISPADTNTPPADWNG